MKRSLIRRGARWAANRLYAQSPHGVHAKIRRLHDPLRVPAARDRATLIFPIGAPVLLDTGDRARAALERWDLAVLAQPATATPLAAPAGSGTALIFLATMPHP